MKESDVFKIPKECPHVNTCSISVDGDHAEHICLTTCWIHCEAIRAEEIRQYKHKPSKWREVLAL